METENKIEELEKELNYWKVDYETKLAENKTNSIKSCLDTFNDFMKSKDFIVQFQDMSCLASSVDFELKIYSQFDYNKEPRRPRRIKIEKKDFINGKNTEFLIGIFNNSPLPEPDHKRLAKNPYENMNMAEIELLEKRKDLKYYKEYIFDSETHENTEYNLFNLTTQTDLGNGKSILKIFEIIVD